ncbi:hypothetical protein BS47DRAFT_1490672 [Hydnum rufescens UP504]|uniref:Uncharacterized protein n=1 Tax=Hydnum rufescens UP504 TaxID=1448309 RepID=A0A9P6DF45_9AGAM|nr:hypothetical protein BS47DRAFT_1490672 [Hydnum rufescens UP504]
MSLRTWLDVDCLKTSVKNLGEIKNSWRRKYNIKEGELEAAKVQFPPYPSANQHIYNYGHSLEYYIFSTVKTLGPPLVTLVTTTAVCPRSPSGAPLNRRTAE